MRIVINAIVERRAERAGGERVDRDPGSREFDREAPGELDDRALARGIASASRRTDEAESAGQGEDATVSGGTHEADGGSAGQPGSDHVDVQAGTQAGDGELVDGSAGLHTGAGYQHV